MVEVPLVARESDVIDSREGDGVGIDVCCVAIEEVVDVRERKIVERQL